MTKNNNYFLMVATILAVGLLVGLVFSFSTVQASNVDEVFGEMGASLEQSYRMVSVAASNEPNSSGEIVFSSSPAAVSAGCTLDTTNVVSYWPLDTNYNDTIGTNNGSCMGTACPTTVTGAAADGRFFIDTDEDIVNVPSTTDFDWANDVDFSVGLWVKTTQDCSGNKVFFGRYRNAPTGYGSWWLGCVPGGYARFHLRDSDNVNRRTTSSTPINDGKWHYIVGVRDGAADQNKIFVDGVLESIESTPGYTGMFASDDVITMGGYDESSMNEYYLSGVLDEVAVFNVALTASDISTYLGTCSFTPDVGDVAFVTDEDISIDITGTELLANSGGGLSIDSIASTSEQGGTITGSNPYTYNPPSGYSGTDFFSFVAIDGSSNSAEGHAVIMVNPIEAPDVEVPADQTNDEGDVVSLQINATDPQGQDMTYEATGLPPDLTIDENSGLISGTIAYTASPNSPYDVTVTVTDTDDNATSVNFTWTVNRVNQPPEVTNPGDQIDAEGAVVSLQIVATDPNDDPLTYGVTNLPDGLGIDTSTGEISGTIAYTASPDSPYAVTVSVDDGEAAPVEPTFLWTVNRINLPPDVTNPGDQSDVEGVVVSLQIMASDANDDPLTYGATNLPDGLSIDTSTGEISGTIATGASDFSPYSVTVSVDDGEAPAVDVTFEWTVGRDNSPPEVTNPGDQSNTEGDTVSLQIVATDPDGDSLEFSAIGLPSGLSINTSTGLISGVIDTGASASSPYDVTVSVDDGYAAPVQVIFTWTVESLMNYIYLPVTFRYCPNFFDDFSNPDSGWFVGESDYDRIEYLDGEYRLLTKEDRSVMGIGAPACAFENYTVEVDVRWVGTPGAYYGILFGIIGNYDQFYVFDMNTDYQAFRLSYFDGNAYLTIVPQTSSPSINSGTASNHLKVTRNGNQINLEVNDTVLGTWIDNNITGATYTGIISASYTGIPVSDARFDNYSLVQLNGQAVSSPIQNSLIGANSGVLGLRESRNHRYREYN
jgi:hypothetical protein